MDLTCVGLATRLWWQSCMNLVQCVNLPTRAVSVMLLYKHAGVCHSWMFLESQGHWRHAHDRPGEWLNTHNDMSSPCFVPPFAIAFFQTARKEGYNSMVSVV